MKYEPFVLEFTPAIIYTQDKPHGIGKLYINGERVRGLIDVKLEAHTRDGNVHFFNLSVDRAKTEIESIALEKYNITDNVIDFEV